MKGITFLEDASKLEIPVMIDCSFFGICKDLVLDLFYPCIERVCFSTSKSFASGNFRSGIEFRKCNVEEHGLISTLNYWEYTQILSARINLELMRKFSPDYIFLKYRHSQLKICEFMNIKPSNTVIFGLDCTKRSNEFSQDGIVNRYCISVPIRNYYDLMLLNEI